MRDKLYQVWHYTKLGIDTVCGNLFENEKVKIGWMVELNRMIIKDVNLYTLVSLIKIKLIKIQIFSKLF